MLWPLTPHVRMQHCCSRRWGSPSPVKLVTAYEAPREAVQPLYEDAQAYEAHHTVHDRHMLVVAEGHITLHIKGFHLKVQGGELTRLNEMQAGPCPKMSNAGSTCNAPLQGIDDIITERGHNLLTAIDTETGMN